MKPWGPNRDIAALRYCRRQQGEFGPGDFTGIIGNDDDCTCLFQRRITRHARPLHPCVCDLVPSARLADTELRSSELQQELAASEEQAKKLREQVVALKAEVAELQQRVGLAQVRPCEWTG